MVELEYHSDKVNQHDIWTAVQQKNVTPDEAEEFETEMQSMIQNLKSELDSLESLVADSVAEVHDAVPKCVTCGEPVDPEETHDGECEDCAEDDDDQHEQEILWA